DFFIPNVVKCRPPQNRDPLPEEISACNGYLARQIALLNPKVIVTLGRFSMAKFFPNERISVIHGQARKINGRIVVAMYHPAAALHQPALRSTLEQDFAGLKPLIANIQKTMEKKPAPPPPTPPVVPPPKVAAAVPPPAPPDDDDGEQLSLF
ncbi:MAG: uracil-DNA glycosylase, partial [Anaerolineae bacterium]|nr:uracil-DNA glycosylase [Anaerolineae bacterium]